jgi:predicted RNA-binding protein with PUA-like domain
MTTQYWLVKQEPESYAWEAFVKDGHTSWDGVRSFPARNHLKAMRRGDQVLFYASGGPKEVQGIATVAREAYPDPTDETGDWVSVELEAGEKLPQPVTLAMIKAEPALAGIALVRQARLSVMPLRRTEFDLIVKMSKPAKKPRK